MGGLFCYSADLFAPGERLRFLLLLTPNVRDPAMSKPVYLDGVMEVQHVTAGASPLGFGLGCLLKNYRVLPDADLHTLDDIYAVLLKPCRFDECVQSEFIYSLQ